jgi:hypothetical protein
MDGVVFRYYASGSQTYADILPRHGLTLVSTHTDLEQNTYYLASRL